MTRLLLATYYTRLAWRDLIRLWPTTQHHVIIVAGICLPILLLLGLKRGHVADLRRELLTSPSGRQIVFWSGQQGELLNASSVKRLQNESPGVELIIPDQERVVTIRKPGAQDTESITIYSTAPGDPILKQVGAELIARAERQVVLAHTIAERLKVVPGEKLILKVERRRDGLEEFAELEVTLRAVLPNNGDQQSAIGFADGQLLDNLEQYVRGFRVEEYGWPALKAAVRDKYAAYLSFCEVGGDYHDADLEGLKERGLSVTPVDDDELKSLYGALKKDDKSKLRIYKIASSTSESDSSRRLILAPSDISEMTEADDVIIPWNGPHTLNVDDRPIRLIGLSLPKRCWLREYFKNEDTAFTYDAPTFSTRPFVGAEFQPAKDSLRIPLDKGDALGFSLKVDVPQATPTDPTNNPAPDRSQEDEGQASNADSPKPPKPATAGDVGDQIRAKADTNGAVIESPTLSDLSRSPTHNSTPSKDSPINFAVPVDMLAQLDAFHSGMADYDPAISMFVPLAETPVYGKARAYCYTIDEVPSTVAALTSRGFAVESQNGRIMEIHDQDHSLQILVWVVGIGVFIFGILTIVSVLTDSTDRKRGTIGILRVMGVSRLGVFYVTVLRAAVIGLLAGIAAASFGYALAAFLGWKPQEQIRFWEWKPQVTVLLHPFDLSMVFLGALLCSGLGAVLPAWKASRLDPFEAIVEGRFR